MKEIKTMHKSRLIAIRQHLSMNDSRNNIEYVIECEQSSIIRVGNELLTNKNITENLDEKPKNHLTKKIYSWKKRKSMKRTILTRKCTGISKRNYNKM